MNKKPEITEKTKQKFIDVFCELYKQKPIEKITILEITKLSGYNRSTFYQYFRDIYDLLEYIENDILNYFKELLELDIEVRIREDVAMHKMSKLYEEKGDCLSSLLGDYGSVRFIEKIKDMLESYIKDFDFTPDNPALRPYIIEFFLSNIIMLFKFWHKNNKNISSDELVILIQNLIRGGVSSQVKEVIIPDEDKTRLNISNLIS